MCKCQQIQFYLYVKRNENGCSTVSTWKYFGGGEVESPLIKTRTALAEWNNVCFSTFYPSPCCHMNSSATPFMSRVIPLLGYVRLETPNRK